MELDVGNHLRQVRNRFWLDVDQVVGSGVVLYVPQVDRQVVCRNKVLAVRTHAQGVDVVVVAVFELPLRVPFDRCAKYLGPRHDYLIALHSSTCSLSVGPVVDLPELDDLVVSRDQPQAARACVVYKGERVDALVDLDAFEMVELRLVRLELCEVPEVEVPRVLELYIPKDNNTSPFVTYSKIFACCVKTYRC